MFNLTSNFNFNQQTNLNKKNNLNIFKNLLNYSYLSFDNLLYFPKFYQIGLHVVSAAR
jgi:hypothetical protein